MNDEFDDNDYYYDEDDYIQTNENQQQISQSYILLSSKEIFERIIKKCQILEDLLEIDHDDAIIILHFYKWDIEKVQNNFFENPQQVKLKAGINPIQPKQQSLQKTCNICLCEIIQNDSLQCGHTFCGDCWQQYLKYQAQDKQSNGFWTCPQEGCNITIKQSFINKYLTQEDDLNQYKKQISLSYTEESRNVKWCPHEGCTYCVENIDFMSQEVVCFCKNTFCINCGNKSHDPCSCEQANQWNIKNSSESENLKWIHVYAKLCPKCRKPIERSSGCNHMTCKILGCGHEFCWVCLEDWSTHDLTAGYYKCNQFFQDKEKIKKQNDINKEKSMLEKYIFYFERFNNASRSEKMAKELMIKVKKDMQNLHEIMQFDVSDLDFLVESTNTLIKCRCVLKWTYTYGFYLDDPLKKVLFEFHQADFEKNCEHLHSLLEKKLDNYQMLQTQNAFQNYKNQVINFTSITRNFMNELLKSIQNGLIDKNQIQQK